MKNMLYFLLYFLSGVMGISSHEIDEYVEPDFSNIVFDVDLDLLRQKQIAMLLSSTATMIVNFGGRLFGYDSSAFVSAKNILNSDEARIELILALLAVEKYPLENDALASLDRLLNEIELGKLSKNFQKLRRGIYDIGASTLLPQIFETIRGLNVSDRLAIIKNAMDREPFIKAVGRYKQLEKSQLVDIEKCFKSMLKNYSED